MVFGYYRNLTPSQKRIYSRSDRIHHIPLPRDGQFLTKVIQLTEGLTKEDRRLIEARADTLALTLTSRLQIPAVHIEVLEKRPSNNWGELHGLYTPAERKGPAKVTVWMRTAKRQQIVAFRTFLRTLVHELCHHFDYELLHLQESFHTEGFYKRESSVLYQLLPRK